MPLRLRKIKYALSCFLAFSFFSLCFSLDSFSLQDECYVIFHEFPKHVVCVFVINFLFWNNLRFIQKFQIQIVQQISIYPSFSFLVNILHYFCNVFFLFQHYFLVRRQCYVIVKSMVKTKHKEDFKFSVSSLKQQIIPVVLTSWDHYKK